MELAPNMFPEPDATLSPATLVQAYLQGCFPMARGRHDPVVEWYQPDPRAVIPLEAFHIPHGLKRKLKHHPFRITRDMNFPGVIRACAAPRPQEEETWINDAIIAAYIRLHDLGLAHSVEAWAPDAAGQMVLAGGLYGVSIGGAFFGESMFSRATDASKICLVHLVEHLRRRGYELLDVQLSNPHLEQFGLEMVPLGAYLQRVRRAVAQPARWSDEPRNG